MENKELKLSFPRSQGFALFITILLVGSLFLLSYSIVQSNLFQSNLNKLKYMNLQANIHLDYVKKYISEHDDLEIKNLSLEDNRFDLKISAKEENAKQVYYVVIEAKESIPIRLSQKIIK